MKKLYLIFALLSAGFTNASVPDSIPNSGFEQWFTATWYDFPAEWFTSNSQLMAPTVVKDSVSHSGNLAMRLTNQGALRPHAWCGFRINSHPLNLGGYVKSLLFNNDSGEIHVRLFLNQQIVDSGYLAIYNGISSLYSAFIVSISQNSTGVDSCEISFEGGLAFQSDILLDDLQFDFFLNTPEIKDNPLAFYPNPCSNQITLNLNEENFYPDEIFAINMTGQRLPLNFTVADMSKEDYIYYLPRHPSLILDVEMLPKGVWILTAKNKSETYTAKLIKN